MVYENCKIYGPYQSKKDNRFRTYIVFPDGSDKTVSYPKYLMEVKENRYLDKNETVHHIDGDVENNDYDNLIILDTLDHHILDAKRVEPVTVLCTWCGTPITIDGRSFNDRNRHNSGVFCSKECVGKYGQSIQVGNSEKKFVPKIKKKYYKNASGSANTR